MAGADGGERQDNSNGSPDEPAAPDDPGPPGVEHRRLAAPTLLQAHVLATSVLTSASENDATYVAVVQDPNSGDAVLVSQDLRLGEVIELDRRPMGEGTAQIVVVGAEIVWGFGGSLEIPGAFRHLVDGVATELDFGGHAPSRALDIGGADGIETFLYTSTRDCAIEQLVFATNEVIRKGDISCFATIESSASSYSFSWVRVDDDPGQSIRQMDRYWPGQMHPVAQGLPVASIGPFPNKSAPPFPNNNTAWWIIPDAAGDSHAMRTTAGGWPATGTEVAVVHGAVDAGALVDDELWGATIGSPANLFRVSDADTVRFDVDYQPVRMIGLHNRLLIETADGQLLEQLLTESE